MMGQVSSEFGRQRVLDIIKEEPKPVNFFILQAKIALEMEELGEIITNLVNAGLIKRTDMGFAKPDFDPSKVGE